MPVRGRYCNRAGGRRDILAAIETEDGPAGVRRNVQTCTVMTSGGFDDGSG